MNKTHALLTALVISLSVGGLAHAKNDKEKDLPPGLQKKVQSGKSLPPGWEKKLEVGGKLDKDLYKQGKVVLTNPDKGTVTLELDGKFVRVLKNTREIVDILDGR
ncbi:hypothetical protein [Kistimonas asteriae]|uniref:hypothetical protein n=1 Tax=Kistimonas asteriae TaxID=517724 RepID=UPI001BAD63A7|nr:hypothetical protein [Kistimonas asteriae]